MDSLYKFNILSKKHFRIALFVILILATIFLRVYKINSIPPGLYQDETAIGYNAYSILQTGKDEYGAKYPLYFKSFGDYKLPVYIYTSSFFIKLFGMNEYAVRLPSVISGILGVAILFFLVKYLTRNISLAYIAGFFLAINPLHLQFSRAGFEVNFALTATLLGTLLFILGVEKKKLPYLFLSILAFAISLYSYNLTRLLSPLILFGCAFLYFKKLKSFKQSELFLLVFFSFLLVLPFTLSFFTQSGIYSATSNLITGQEIVAKNIEFRSYLSSTPQIFVKFFYNKYIFQVFKYFENLATILSGTFYFVSGSDHPNHGIGDIGIFYLFELPFFITGIVAFFSKKLKSLRIFFFWLIASVLVLALSKDVPHATRGYFIIVPEIVFSSLGVLIFLQWLKTMPNKLYRVLILVGVLCFVFYNIQYYFTSYYFRFPSVYAANWRFSDKTLSDYLAKVSPSYDKIIINDKTDFIYTSLLFYTSYPPRDFIKSVVRYKDGSLIKVRSFGKYEFRSINWEKDELLPNTLFITTVMDKPFHAPVLKNITNPTRQVAIEANDSILQFPKTDVAYVIIDSKDLQNKLLKK